MKRKASTDFRTYSLNPICQITSISTVRQIEQASNVTKSIRTTDKACLFVCVRVFVWLMFLLLSLTYRFSTIILFVL